MNLDGKPVGGSNFSNKNTQGRLSEKEIAAMVWEKSSSL